MPGRRDSIPRFRSCESRDGNCVNNGEKQVWGLLIHLIPVLPEEQE